jgi:hypothetical protein
MSTVQTRIAELLIKHATEQNHPLRSFTDGKSPQEVCYLIFHSYRGNERSARGWRLSEVGLQLLKTFFKCYHIQMPAGYAVKLPHLLYLDRVSSMPYWLSDKDLTVFDTELGAMLKMCDGSLDLLIETRFRLTIGGTQITKD